MGTEWKKMIGIRVVVVGLFVAVFFAGYYVGSENTNAIEKQIVTVPVYPTSKDVAVNPISPNVQEVFEIVLLEPLVLTGMVGTSDVFDICIDLDTSSIQKLPRMSDDPQRNSKMMCFQKEDSRIANVRDQLLSVTAGTKIQIELSTFTIDRRGVETTDRGVIERLLIVE